MLSNKKLLTNKKGFSVLAVLLIIIVLIVGMSAWMLSGQTNTESILNNNTVEVQATSIVEDSNNIKLYFDSLVYNGTDPMSIVFQPNAVSAGGAPNLLDPVNGIQLPKPLRSALRDGATVPDGIWIYTNNFQSSGIGTTNTDIAIFLAGIKDSVCERINFNLMGNTYIPKLNGAKTQSVQFFPGLTETNPNVVLFKYGVNAIPTPNWNAGCFKANTSADGQNVFFRVLKTN